MKLLYLEIDNCTKCPHFAHESFSDCSHKAGYFCSLSGKRIANEDDYKLGMSIPNWCELPDKD